jgi:hypothetical protein
MGVEATLGLAAIILVLGVTYWLIRDHDDRLLGAKLGSVGEGEWTDGHEIPSAPQKHPASAAMEKTTTN